MLKKQQKANKSTKAKAKEKGKQKVWYMKILAFLFVSVYDVITWVGIAFFVGFALIYGFQHNWRGVMWSIALLLCCVIIMIAIRADQHFFQNVAPQKLSRAELRAHKAQVKLRAGYPEEVAVAIRNFGDLTATNLWLDGRTYVKPKDFNGPLEREGWTRSDSPTDILPDTDITVVLLGDRSWTNEGVQMAKRRDILLFHYSEGMYQDEAGNEYPISFCFRYEPGFPLMGLCDRSHWPEDV